LSADYENLGRYLFDPEILVELQRLEYLWQGFEFPGLLALLQRIGADGAFPRKPRTWRWQPP
jgi:hypothetical protein